MVDFTRFMGRGALEPRFAPMPITPAPAPLPSVTPAPMPAPVAPLPNVPGLPDLSNIDFSGLPGLPQMPLPAPVAAPAPAPTPAPTPAPLPPADPYMGMTQADLAEIGVNLPQPVAPMPMPAPTPVPVTPPPLPPEPVQQPIPVVEPAPPPALVTPPPLPPQPVAPPPPPAPVVEPAPLPTPITPPPTPPTPVAPPFVPAVEPAPTPTPITPPPTPPTPTPSFVPEPRSLEPEPPITMPAPVAPVVEPAPVVPPAPAPVEPVALPPSRALEPEPPTGIETLAPEDFTMPAGIVAGPMSTPAVNNRVDAAEATIPLPDGGLFNLDRMEFDSEGIPMVDPQIIQNAVADAGLAPAPVTTPAPATTPTSQPTVTSSLEPDFPVGRTDFQLDSEGIPIVDPQIIQNALSDAGIEVPATTTTPTSTVTPNLDAGLTMGDTFLTEPAGNFYTDGQLADMGMEPGGVDTTRSTLTPAQQAAVDAAIQDGELTFGGPGIRTEPAGNYYTDGQLAEMGAEPGSTVVSQDPTTTLTPEQQAALDAYLAANPGGLVTTPFGNFNIPNYGGTTGTTPRPVVDPIANLAVNRTAQPQQVSVATQYGLSGAAPVQTPSTNPFLRPESQQGIGSLAGGG